MSRGDASTEYHLGLRAGDWVIVKSREEILSTLDERGCLEALSFQPEMFAFCGRRMRVSKTAHKTCDNIKKTGGRRMYDTVHLEGSRCDGAAHGGCQADCVFFWREAWLRRADAAVPELVQLKASRCTEQMVMNAVRAPGDTDADPTWVCQVTTLYDATYPLKWWDIRQYVRDVTSGNHSLMYIIRILVAAMYRRFVNFGRGYRAKIALYNAFQGLHGGKPYPEIDGVIKDGDKTPTEILNLQPGQWVQVRSPEEIEVTLTKNGFNRGMRYDLGMVRYSGGTYRVQMRVDRLINEITGKMMQMKSPCIQLEDVWCRAECTDRRLGCPRASNTYWREIWLRPVDEPRASSGSTANAK